eukprot:CAMPEP_0178393852 /NCGR_PEP_ID=MMETSP0689_2-20121128/12399_1 /TAXON_ID=160604 /ORGANISM="Amphidinium massartii, Strain CS-259" /LENGTH=47 /DNA_ID= /DNA_START= /DNA_END= /DNA_ORIENTATION=
MKDLLSILHVFEGQVVPEACGVAKLGVQQHGLQPSLNIHEEPDGVSQ